MPAAQRMGDANSGGGVITSIPQSTVFINGLAAAVNGSTGTAHPPAPLDPTHDVGIWSTTGGNSTVSFGGISANATGDTDTCGDTRVGGSGTVNIG